MGEKDELPQPIPKVGWPRVQFDGYVPTVLDRFIQQAVMQVLQKQWNPTFSHHSYGFRPGGRRIKPWHKRSSILRKATAG